MNYDKLHRTLVLKYGSWEKPEETYTERHRILPGCLGGEYVEGNAFYVPARVHFIAHWLLAKIYLENLELAHALFRMSNSRKYGSKIYSWAKEHWVGHIRGENNPAKRSEVRKKISENNPMNDPKMVEKAARYNRSEEGRKRTSIQFSGSNNPSCRPEVKEKRAEHMRKRHAEGDKSIDLRGDKSPSRNPDTLAKIIKTRSENLKKAKAEGRDYGLLNCKNHCMKKPEYQKAASNSAKKQWQNPEIRAKMSEAIRKNQVRAICLTCGMESTIGNIVKHQKSKNHSGIERKVHV